MPGAEERQALPLKTRAQSTLLSVTGGEEGGPLWPARVQSAQEHRRLHHGPGGDPAGSGALRRRGGNTRTSARSVWHLVGQEETKTLRPGGPRRQRMERVAGCGLWRRRRFGGDHSDVSVISCPRGGGDVPERGDTGWKSPCAQGQRGRTAAGPHPGASQAVLAGPPSGMTRSLGGLRQGSDSLFVVVPSLLDVLCDNYYVNTHTRTGSRGDAVRTRTRNRSGICFPRIRAGEEGRAGRADGITKAIGMPAEMEQGVWSP